MLYKFPVILLCHLKRVAVDIIFNFESKFLSATIGVMLMCLQSKARKKKNFGSGQLIFENWSGGPVDLFSFFLNHNINIPNLIVQKS